MKNRRLKFEYRSNASKLHKAVGDCLRDSDIFSGFTIYQEYPVSRINSSFTNNKMHFDWVIPDIFLVIEAHGKQHYSIQTFGATEDKATLSYESGKIRDIDKMNAALDAGYTYIIVPYTDEKIITDKYLWDMYKKNENKERSIVVEEKPISNYNKELHKKHLKSDYHQEQLFKARQDRKKKYTKMKQKLKESKDDST